MTTFSETKKYPNLISMLLERAQQRPDLKIGTTDQQITLSEALAHAAGGAEQLTHAGLGAGQRAAIVATTSTNYMVTWIACQLAGVPVALVNPTYPSELLEEMLDNLDPAIVFTDLDDGTFAGERTVEHINATGHWATRDPNAAPGVAVDKFAVVSYMHTSGTTGIPKFCAQSNEYFLRLGASMAKILRLTSSDRMLAPLPLFHINPLGYGIVGALTAGADALTVGKFSARGFWPIVKDNAITALALHAPPVEILKRSTAGSDALGHQVRTMFYADSEFMARFGISNAVSGYGSTEAAGVSHLHAWKLADDIPSNVSRYGGHTRCDVEDDLLPSGEIVVREREPGTLFSGYFSRGQLNTARDENGWYSTGDLGRHDDNGGLVFLERAAESIRVNGEFVPIPYVEEKLGAIRELDDFALWKKPGELVDDDVVLYVVADQVPVEAIAKVSSDLPAFMRPAHIAQIASIPRDAAAGKVQRRLLHQQEVTSMDNDLRVQGRGHNLMPEWAADMADLHVHAAPSLLPRHGNDGEAVATEKALGFSTVVLKSHEGSTVERAALAGGAQAGIYGGTVLNSAIGGANPDAIEVAARLGGRVVWMPTVSSATHKAGANRPELRVHKGFELGLVEVFKDGKLLPAWLDVLEVVARHDLLLASGHLSANETVELFRIARDCGVNRLMVNHPKMAFLRWNDEAAQALRDLGANLELGILPDILGKSVEETSLALTDSYPHQLLVFGADLGHAHHPAPPAAVPAWMWELERRVGENTAQQIMTANTRELLLP